MKKSIDTSTIKENNIKISSSVNKKVRASVFYNFFRSYYKSERSFKKSITGALVSSERIGAWVRIFKNMFSKSCESSLIVNAITKLYEKLINCSIKSYAIVTLYFGIYTLVIEFIKASVTGVFEIIPDNAYYGAILIILSLLFMPFTVITSSFSSRYL